MNLKEFLLTADADNQIALDAAKLHPLTTGVLIHRDSMNSILAIAGIYVRFKEIAIEANHPFQNLIAAFLDSTEYNFKQSEKPSSTGMRQIAALDAIINANIDVSVPLASIKPAIMAKANQITYPFANTTLQDIIDERDSGEVVSLPINNAQHVLSMSITTKPSKTISVKVQQRFGADNTDLTEWHDCGSFVGVNYTQQTYKSQIAASPAPYRELRAVSDITIGMSIV